MKVKLICGTGLVRPIIILAAVLTTSTAFAADSDAPEPLGKVYHYVPSEQKPGELPPALMGVRSVIEARSEREKFLTDEERRQRARSDEHEARRAAKIKEIEDRRAALSAEALRVQQAHESEAMLNAERFSMAMTALGIPAIQLKKDMENPHQRIIHLICGADGKLAVNVSEFLEAGDVTVEKSALEAAFSPSCN